MSSSVSGCRVSSRQRDSSGDTTEKNGFSVVAPIRVTQRFSTAGSSASCWVFEKRWTSSMNSTVRRPVRPRSRRASAMAARTSRTPAATADSSVNRSLVPAATTCASVVLPVPWWTPEEQGRRLALFDEAAQRGARPGDVTLPEHVGQGLRPQPDRERRDHRLTGVEQRLAGHRSSLSTRARVTTCVRFITAWRGCRLFAPARRLASGSGRWVNRFSCPQAVSPAARGGTPWP